MPQGTLFTEDFLNEGIRETDAWRELPEDLAESLRAQLASVFARIASPARLNEAQTEERIVQPIFEALHWGGCFSVQERAEIAGRANVPDYLLFSSKEAFAKADGEARAADRYPFGVAVADAKAWALGLDQRGAGAGSGETPSGQIIRYLTRADVQSDGKVLWGILTNGRHWRLYYQRAKSRLEDYFEIDLAWVLGLAGSQGELGINGRPDEFASDEEWSDHLLKLFWLMFRREALLPGPDGRAFHQVALDEGRNWETKVREDLTDLVFKKVFPDLLRALVRADRKRPAELNSAYLAAVRDAALTLLYRLLFALYAEDRDLLPKRDPRYGGLAQLRNEVAERVDKGTTLSRKRTAFAHDCMELFHAIDQGDEDIGLPPYNGGLFSDRTAATELLERALLPDADFAPLLDRLGRTEKAGRRVRINFRDLSVQQLGSIYEMLWGRRRGCGTLVAARSSRWSVPMPQACDFNRARIALEQDCTLIAVVEMSLNSWLVAGIVPGIERHPLKKLAVDEHALLKLLRRWQAEAIKAGHNVRRVAVAFEAGRDGFWLARWLRARDVEAYVIHASSVAVSREHRRAKTDRLDTELLKRAFVGWLRGEPHHCHMAAIPTIEEEDAKRANRERENLVCERSRIINRMKACLIRFGVRSFKPTLRRAPELLARLRTPEGVPLPPNTIAEMRRDMARLRFVRDQIKEIEEARLQGLERAPKERTHAMVRLLARVIGVGIETADMLVHEVLSRNMRDRRAVARYAGLTGSPDESGRKRREKGLARAGNARVRRGMVQLAWRFLRFQKDSALAQWYRMRTANARAGTRNTMIVALARKLLIALWRLVTAGEVPAGIVMRAA